MRKMGSTLLELLVAMGILALILILFSQVITHLTGITVGARERLDADAAARVVLDLMAADLANRLRRSDADFLVKKEPGNDAFYFYSEAPAYLGANSADTVAIIGYRIQGNNGLERIGKGVSSGTNGFVPYPCQLDPSGFPANVIQPLGPEVFRMELEFMKTDGSIIAAPPTRADSGKPGYLYLSGSNTLAEIAPDQIPDWEDLQAMIITIAVLDAEHQVLLPDLSNVATQFGDALTSGTEMVHWEAIADHLPPEVPNPVRSGIRVYRRFIFLQ